MGVFNLYNMASVRPDMLRNFCWAKACSDVIAAEGVMAFGSCSKDFTAFMARDLLVNVPKKQGVGPR